MKAWSTWFQRGVIDRKRFGCGGERWGGEDEGRERKRKATNDYSSVICLIFCPCSLLNHLTGKFCPED